MRQLVACGADLEIKDEVLLLRSPQPLGSLLELAEVDRVQRSTFEFCHPLIILQTRASWGERSRFICSVCEMGEVAQWIALERLTKVVPQFLLCNVL